MVRRSTTEVPFMRQPAMVTFEFVASLLRLGVILMLFLIIRISLRMQLGWGTGLQEMTILSVFISYLRSLQEKT